MFQKYFIPSLPKHLVFLLHLAFSTQPNINLNTWCSSKLIEFELHTAEFLVYFSLHMSSIYWIRFWLFPLLPPFAKTIIRHYVPQMFVL